MELPLFSVLDTVRELGWSGAVELFRNGLALGSLYALIALGYTMVYGILKLLNFAHGDVYMVGAFIGFGVLNAFGGAACADDRDPAAHLRSCSSWRCSAPERSGS